MTVGLGVLILISFMMSVTVPGRQPARAAFPGDRGLITFESRRDGAARDKKAAEIYVMEADGSNQRNLTNNEHTDIASTFSPDGTEIAFWSDRDGNEGDIYVMDVDGANVRRLTSHAAWDRDPAWSPDGRWIIFSSHRSGTADLYAVASSGGKLTQLTRGNASDGHPAWSPDGATIVFFSNIDGGYDIYSFSIREDNGQLARGRTKRLTRATGIDFVPNWSPDGSQIAFASGRDKNCDPRPSNPGLGRRDCAEIYVMAKDGSNQRRVTFSPTTDSEPNWSPDGALIVFYTERDDDFEVYSVEVDGDNPTNLSDHAKPDYSPDWQPIDDGPLP